MRGRNNEVIVPAGCPVERTGIVDDLSEMPFDVSMHFTPRPDGEIVEVFGNFGDPGGDGLVVYTEVPGGSPLARSCREEYNRARADQDPGGLIAGVRPETLEQIRRRLCDNVRSCRMQRIGECPALGPIAVQQALNDVLLGEEEIAS